jgi:hypothetical protein
MDFDRHGPSTSTSDPDPVPTSAPAAGKHTLAGSMAPLHTTTHDAAATPRPGSASTR